MSQILILILRIGIDEVEVVQLGNARKGVE